MCLASLCDQLREGQLCFAPLDLGFAVVKWSSILYTTTPRWYLILSMDPGDVVRVVDRDQLRLLLRQAAGNSINLDIDSKLDVIRIDMVGLEDPEKKVKEWSKTFSSLADAIERADNISVISFTGLNFGYEGWKRMLKAIASKMTTLKRLSLTNCSNGQGYLPNLPQLFDVGVSGIQEISVTELSLPERDVAALFQKLADSTIARNLIRFSFVKMNPKLDRNCRLSSFLQQCVELEDIDIAETKVESSALLEILTALLDLNKIRVLRLRAIDLHQPDHIEQLKAVLQDKHQLSVLDLAGNPIPFEAIILLLDAVSTKPELRGSVHLRLDHLKQEQQQLVKDKRDLISRTSLDLAKGGDIFGAAARNDRSAVEQLLKHTSLHATRPATQETLAHVAGPAVLGLLLERNTFDFSQRDSQGNTCLHSIAAFENHAVAIACIGLLSPVGLGKKLSSSLDFNALNFKGLSALHVATTMDQTRSSNWKVVESLCQVPGVDADLSDRSGRTPLHYAASGFLKTVSVLLRYCDRVDSYDNSGETPLMVAARANKPKIVAELLRVGAGIDYLDSWFPEIADGGSPGTVQVLRDFISSPEYANARNRLLIRNLVFQGGGIKGLAYFGALKQLFNPSAVPHGEGAPRAELENILRLAGTSAGAITACVLAVGYSLEEAEKIVSDMALEEFLDGELSQQVLQAKDTFSNGISVGGIIKYALGHLSTVVSMIETLKKHGGLCLGEKFRTWMDDIIAAKLTDGKNKRLKFATFADLRARALDPANGGRYKQLYVIGCNLETNQEQIFSAETTPNMIISDAVRISMSIPFVFRPHQVHIRVGSGDRISVPKSHSYVDGGVLNNFPLKIFDSWQYLAGLDLREQPPASSPSTSSRKRQVYNHQTLGLRLKIGGLEASVAEREGQVDPGVWVAQHSVTSAESTSQSGINSRDSVNLLKSTLGSLVRTYLEHESNANARDHDADKLRIVFVDPGTVSTMDFNITPHQKSQLIEVGSTAVGKWRGAWNEQKRGIAASKSLTSAKVPREILAEIARHSVAPVATVHVISDSGIVASVDEFRFNTTSFSLVCGTIEALCRQHGTKSNIQSLATLKQKIQDSLQLLDRLGCKWYLARENGSSNTLAMYCCQAPLSSTRPACMEAITAAGASPAFFNYTNKEGMSVLDLAMSLGEAEASHCVLHLLPAGARMCSAETREKLRHLQAQHGQFMPTTVAAALQQIVSPDVPV
eukprot:TRINITY_DN69_c0_g1_i4.p1 TRINITY_DN69_c0_g1~~TRINITY_DN69_c0_g1_i4.p1  ORF type:complete len:1227 (+),score=160.05 TRINITY_DN69_c0_g1_i4:737-4417(+)